MEDLKNTEMPRPVLNGGDPRISIDAHIVVPTSDSEMFGIKCNHLDRKRALMLNEMNQKTLDIDEKDLSSIINKYLYTNIDLLAVDSFGGGHLCINR